MSERRAQTDFLEQHIRNHKHEEGIAVISHAIWDVQPDGTYSGKTFLVFCGDTSNAPRILKPDEEMEDEANVVEVPEDHREDFEADLEDAIRRVAGRATVATSALFRRPSVLREAVKPTMAHPFTRDEITLSTGSPVEIADFVREDVLFRMDLSRLKPRLDGAAPRFMHVDLASTGCAAGIACVHMKTTGADYRIVVDFVLRINPPPPVSGHEIDFEKILNFIRYLREKKFPLHLVTFDKYQSRHSVQIIRKMGIQAGFISVDESDDAYVNLKGLFESGQIEMCDYPTVFDELSRLEHDIVARKVYRTSGNSKDVADALAGAAYNLIPERTAPRGSRILEELPSGRRPPVPIMTVGSL
jgi:hypothetical protein